LEAALLASTGVLVCLSKVDEGCVDADDLTREAALCRHGDGSLVCAGSLGRGGQLIKLREVVAFASRSFTSPFTVFSGLRPTQ